MVFIYLFTCPHYKARFPAPFGHLNINERLSVSWQFFETYAVIRYSSDWCYRYICPQSKPCFPAPWKDVVTRCLNFNICLNCLFPRGSSRLCRKILPQAPLWLNRLGLCHNTLTPTRTPRLGLCHSALTPTSTPRLGLCHSALTPTSTPRLGLCHSALTPARTPRLGLCHNSLTPARTPWLHENVVMLKNLKQKRLLAF